MKRNWLAFLGRAIVVILIFAVVYEGIKALLNLYPQFRDLLLSDNLIVRVITWLILPVCGIGIFYSAFNFIRRGLRAPRLNWAKGLERLATVIGVISVAVFLIIVFIVLVKDTGDIVVALGIFAVGGGVIAVGCYILRLAEGWIGSGFRNRGDDE